MADLKEKREEIKKTRKEVEELRKQYAKKYADLRKEYFEELKKILPEKEMPKFMKEGKFNPEEMFKDFPKPPFMMDAEEVEKVKAKRKEFFEKMEKNDPIFKLFEMANSKKDED